LSEWLSKPELKPDEYTVFQKCTFFDSSYKSIPEFAIQNHYVTFKESERAMLLEHLANVEEE
jgi:hypothetical protein